MKGRSLPSHVSRRKRDGVILFRKRYGGKIKEVRMQTQFPEGAQVPFALHQEREKLLNAPIPVAGGRDIAAVLRHYHASPEYRNKKPRTRLDYDKRTTYLNREIGHLNPRDIERRHIIGWRDLWAKKSPHEANYRLRVLSIILEHAKDMGLLSKSDENPTKGVKSVQYDKKERQPWPQELIDAYRKEATGRELLLLELCLGSGQRISDVLKMKWGDIESDGINVRQGKTGKHLWVPMTSHLKAALAATTPRSVFILTNQTATGPWSYRGASQAVRNVREAIGALDYDIHSLRYTAASELASAGADDDVIASVTGQSKAMVILYTQTVRQRVRALKAKEMRE